MIEAFGLAIIVGLIWLAVSVSKGQAAAETKLDLKEAENEIITKQRDASIDNVDDAISMLTGKKRK